MKEPKPFKTIDEQIELLENRNIIIDNKREAKEFLLSNNYYQIINAYKAPFIDSRRTTPENDIYKTGTTLFHFVTMFYFDEALRIYTLQALARAERTIRTSAVYSFCDIFRDTESYLIRKNYNDLIIKQEDKPDETAHNLIKVLKKAKRNPFDKGYIHHYLEEYNSVPLWVLAPSLTFGNIRYFYLFQLDKVKNNISYNLAEAIGSNYVNDKHIKNALKILPAFRNVAAHHERLYNFRFGHLNQFNFKSMLDSLRHVVSKKHFEEYNENIIYVLKKLRDSNLTPLYNEALSGMGITENYIIRHMDKNYAQ